LVSLRANITLKFYPVNTATSHLIYKLPLYITTPHFSKTMNKLDLTIAFAADIGMNKTFIYRVLIAVQQQLDAEGFAGRAVVQDGLSIFMPRRVMG
jgi:hypothetical protein